MLKIRSKRQRLNGTPKMFLADGGRKLQQVGYRVFYSPGSSRHYSRHDFNPRGYCAGLRGNEVESIPIGRRMSFEREALS